MVEVGFSRQVRLHWIKLRNFGDLLSPEIVARMCGVSRNDIEHVPNDSAEPFMTAVGSMLGSLRGPRIAVWGSGIINQDDRPGPAVTYHVVRGPHTRMAILKNGGVCDPSYGDPVMLLPRWFPRSPKALAEWGIVPHFLEFLRIGPTTRASVIDVRKPIHTVISEITRCEKILSMSLHGLVCAHAYGVPAVYVRASTLPYGDGVKFSDYLESVGLDPTPLVLSNGMQEVDSVEILRRADKMLRLPNMAEHRTTLQRTFGAVRSSLSID
jgi:pyruvyltransferase